MGMYDFDAIFAGERDDVRWGEWSGVIKGTDVTLKATQISGRESVVVGKKFPDMYSNFDAAVMVEFIVRKAKDPEGNVAFKPKHREHLLGEGLDKIAEMFAALFPKGLGGMNDEEFEDDVKNS
jgi:hypothetical protein